jgi:hypothetical protein
MRVLVDCECSRRVASAFRNRGHDAWSCDLEPAEDGSPYHIQGDAIDALYSERWDLVIAHPPCTRLANSGVQWLQKRNLWADLERDAEFFNAFIDFARKKDIPVGIENPIQHRYARGRIQVYDQIIQPWQFWHLDEPGTGEQKATCLWLLNGLPPLVPTTPNETGRHQACWRMGPGPNRARERSRTYRGIADAMADQWGAWLIKRKAA